MMDFYEAVRRRRSIRGYRNTPIPDTVLRRIAEAISLAPSACNLQPWRFEIIFNPALREKICDVYRQPWLREAPAIVAAIGNEKECWHRPEGTPITDIDIAIAMEHMVLAAAAEGLGSCWICAYDKARMNSALNVSAPWSVLAISPLGFPGAPPTELRRKDINETVRIIK